MSFVAAVGELMSVYTRIRDVFAMLLNFYSEPGFNKNKEIIIINAVFRFVAFKSAPWLNLYVRLLSDPYFPDSMRLW